MIELSQSRLEQKAAEEWSKYAQEPVTVDYIAGALFAFGSELAMLRLARHMRHGRAEYSENRKSWYWMTECKFPPNAA
jgi:hypothetical protein